MKNFLFLHIFLILTTASFAQRELITQGRNILLGLIGARGATTPSSVDVTVDNSVTTAVPKISLSEISTNLIVGPRPASISVPNGTEKNDTVDVLLVTTAVPHVAVNFNGTRISLAELNTNLVTGNKRPQNALAPSDDVAIDFTESNDTAKTALTTRFDCRRTGHDCDSVGGVCNLDTGACNCEDSTYTTFTCGHPLETIVDDIECNNGTGCGDDGQDAFCINSNEIFSCMCPYHLYGDSCEKPRLELRCSETFMTLNVAPYGTPSFKGQIYLIDMVKQSKIDDKLCTFPPLQAGVSTLRIPYQIVASKCGGESPEVDTHQIRFIIQSDPDWLTSYDQVITARCSSNVSKEYQKTVIVEASSQLKGVGVAAGGLHVSNDLENVAANSIEAERTKVELTTILPTPVLSILQDDSGVEKEINGSVRIGDVVIFKIENVNDTFYTAMRAEECTLKMDDMLSAALLKQQCPASRLAWSLLQWSKTEIGGKLLKFHLRLPANAAAGRPRQVTITCRVKMCAPDVAKDCEASQDNCKSATSAFLVPPKQTSRKRRSVADNNQDPTTIVTVMKTFDLDYEEDEFSAAPLRQKHADASSSGQRVHLITSPLLLLFAILAKFI